MIPLVKHPLLVARIELANVLELELETVITINITYSGGPLGHRRTLLPLHLVNSLLVTLAKRINNRHLRRRIE